MAGPMLEAARHILNDSPILTGAAIAVTVLAALLAVWLWRRLDRRREAELQDLAALAAALSAAPDDAGEVAEAAYVHSSRLIPSDFFQLGLFQEDVYRTLIWVRDGDRLRNREFALDPEHQGLIGWIRSSGEPLLVPDFLRPEGLPAQPSYASEDPPRSGLFVPILVDGTAVGVVAAQSRKRAAFHRRELLLMKGLAGGLGSALAALAWRDEVRQRERQLGLVEDVARLLTPLRPVSEVMPEAAETIARRLDADRVAVLQGAGPPWIVEADAGNRHPVLFGPEGVEPLLAEAAQTLTLATQSRPSTQASRTLWQVAAPLRVQDRVVGVMYVNRQDLPFLRPDRRLIELVASQLALAFLEASNYSQQQEEAWFTTVLLEVARHASRPGDLASALQSVLELTTLLAGAGWAILLIADSDTDSLAVGPVAGLRRADLERIQDERFFAGDFGLRPPLREEGHLQVDLPASIAEAAGAPTALASILSDGSRLLGIMLVGAEGFEPRRLELLSGIARQISLRLENAMLIEQSAERRSLERELETARSIQEGFLPSAPPQVTGWEVRAFYRAARSVGGDFYDFIPLPPGPEGDRWGLAIADVSDKGVPAALYMALSRTLLRTIAPTETSPGATLQRLNHLLLHDTRADMFVSLWYAVWEPDTGRLTFSNAGHSPPLLFTPGARPERLRVRHIVLGVLPEVDYRDQTLVIPEDGMLLLYTDGVSEAQDPQGDLFEVEGIEATVESLETWSPGAVVEALEWRLAEFGGPHDPIDDLTMVCLQRLPAAPPDNPPGG